jgi:hypothetical protein
VESSGVTKTCGKGRPKGCGKGAESGQAGVSKTSVRRHARSFHGGAGVHDDIQADCAGAIGSDFVDHAELKPHGLDNGADPLTVHKAVHDLDHRNWCPGKDVTNTALGGRGFTGGHVPDLGHLGSTCAGHQRS